LNIAATAELLNTTSGELSSVKLDLTNTRIDLAAAVMKLGEMNNELIKVKRDFTIKLEGNFNLTRDEFHQVIVIELHSHCRALKHNRQEFGENE
jgi:hypothetical protein